MLGLGLALGISGKTSGNNSPFLTLIIEEGLFSYLLASTLVVSLLVRMSWIASFVRGFRVASGGLFFLGGSPFMTVHLNLHDSDLQEYLRLMSPALFFLDSMTWDANPHLGQESIAAGFVIEITV